MIEQENTTNLMDELSSARELASFMSKYEFGDNKYLSFVDYVDTIIQQKNLKKSMIIRKIHMTRSFAYDIFSGKKIPSRDNTILLSYGLELGFKGTQRLLLSAKHNPLHPKDKRDSIIIFAKMNKHTLMETNMLLYDFNQKVLD